MVPIVERELRVASRRGATYWVRASGALVAIFVASVILSFQFAMAAVSGSSGLGTAIFWSIGGLSFAAALLSGVIYTADAISKERREGTLGLLFLTDLRGRDIALGKLASNGTGVLYCLAAMQPVMAISLLLGGVTEGEYARLCLLLIITACTSLALGLFCSTCGRTARTPPALTLLVLLAACAGFPLAGAIWAYMAERLHWAPAAAQSTVKTLVSLSPASGLRFCSATGYPFGASQYWGSILYTGFVGVAALAGASWRLPRTWQEQNAGAPAAAKRAAANTDGTPAPQIRPLRPRVAKLLDENPILWLCTKRRGYRAVPWILSAVSAGGTGLAIWKTWDLEMNASMTFTASNVLLGFFQTPLIWLFKAWIANESGRQLLDDRRSGALELQMVTPLGAPKIIRGHLSAIWRQMRCPLILIMIAGVAAMLPQILRPNSMAGVTAPPTVDLKAIYYVALVNHLIAVALLPLQMLAIALVSLDGAVTLKGGRIALYSLFLIVVVPWIASAVVLPSVMYLGMSSGFGTRVVAYTPLVSTALTGLNALSWALMAYKSLPRHLRSACDLRPASMRAQPGSTPPPLPPVLA